MTERETLLRTALVAVMNDIDFTEHRCRMIDPIAQCLSREALDLAHAAIKEPDDIGPTTMSPELQRQIHFEENIRGAGNHLASLVKNATPRELFVAMDDLDGIQTFLGQLQTRAKTWRPEQRYDLYLWNRLISSHASPRAVISAIREKLQGEEDIRNRFVFFIMRGTLLLHRVHFDHGKEVKEDYIIGFSCPLCTETYDQSVSVPDGWSIKGRGVDVESNAFCPKHAKVKDWLENQCPGCVSGWGECGLFKAYAFSELTIDEGQFEEIKKGVCPFRVNGTFEISDGKMSDIDLSEQASDESGEALVAAIRDYAEFFHKKSEGAGS